MDKKHKAKREALQKLRKAMMSDSGKGVMSVKVVAKDPESLKKGLEKAEELTEGKYNNGGIVEDDIEQLRGHDYDKEEDIDHDADPDEEDEYKGLSRRELLDKLRKKR
jgi:hypothetical protein